MYVIADPDVRCSSANKACVIVETSSLLRTEPLVPLCFSSSSLSWSSKRRRCSAWAAQHCQSVVVYMSQQAEARRTCFASSTSSAASAAPGGMLAQRQPPTNEPATNDDSRGDSIESSRRICRTTHLLEKGPFYKMVRPFYKMVHSNDA